MDREKLGAAAQVPARIEQDGAGRFDRDGWKDDGVGTGGRPEMHIE